MRSYILNIDCMNNNNHILIFDNIGDKNICVINKNSIINNYHYMKA